jgi:NAD-reducing hydrogenase small subunit
MPRLTLATCSLAGCFGCHTSLLDIDERLVDLLKRVALTRTPFTDIKSLQGKTVDLGMVEGGVDNAQSVATLREFRDHCRILVSLGECAITGNVPAMRNHFPLKACLEEAYVTGPGLLHPRIPSDPELPLLLDRVRTCHEIVKIDYFLPGCPPSADAIWHFLTALLEGRDPRLPAALLRYD